MSVDFRGFSIDFRYSVDAQAMIFVETMEDTGRKVKNGPRKWHVDVESRYVGGCGGPSWPKLAALVRSNWKKCSLPRQGA